MSPRHGPFAHLVIAGGRAPGSAFLKKLARLCRFVVTVDRGADAAFGAGLQPDFHVGDDDSISKAALLKIPRSKRVKLPAKKSVSDLEFALAQLPRKSLKIIAGAHRDNQHRPDHVFVNLLLAMRNPGAYWVDEKIWIKGLAANENFSFKAPKGTTFSVVCLRPQKVSITGAVYTVRNQVFPHPSFGLSNQTKGKPVVIQTRGPALLFVASDFLDSRPR